MRGLWTGGGDAHLVGVLGVDIVLDGLVALLAKVLRGYLDQVRYFCLWKRLEDGSIWVGSMGGNTHEDEHFGCQVFWSCWFLSWKSQD